jgi:hypothetical protein
LARLGTGLAFSLGHERRAKEKGMKKRMKWLASVVVLMTFACTSCAGVQVPVKTASDVKNVKPNDQYKYSYKVTFVNGETYTVDDEDLDSANGAIGIRFGNEQEFRYYAPDQITSIKRKVQRRAGMGALIGLGAGAAAGVGGAFAIAKTSCRDSSDPDHGECSFFRDITAVGVGFVGPILGTAIGAIVGASIKQKKKTSNVKFNVSPKVYTTEKMKVQGAGLGISGSF